MLQGFLFSDDDLSTLQATAYAAHAAPRTDRRKQHPFATCGTASPPCPQCAGRKPTPAPIAPAAPIFIPQCDEDGSAWGDFDSCLTAFRTNRCTLNGEPARVIGTPRTAPYATIEPIDLDLDPIHCHWDSVDMVMQDGGDFVREDDDTGE